MTTTPTPIGSDFAGHIHVRLSVHGGVVEDVAIESTRPKGVAKVFTGRTPAEVVGLLGQVFSLCATAQSVAGLEAVEAALGLKVSDRQRAARHMLREAEMLSQTVLRVSMDWTRLLGLPPAVAAARAALAAEAGLKTDLFSDRDWKVPGGIRITPDVDGVRARLDELHDALNTVLNEESLGEKLLAALDRQKLNGFGARTDGAEVESGALSRQWLDPDVVRARKAYGAGLRARLMARFADIRDLCASLTQAANALGSGDTFEQDPCSDGDGAATVETARGALTHRVAVKNGNVVAYEIDAPTDVNFLNGGVVAQGLLGATAGTDLSVAAELHVLAIDPCVDCVVEIGDA